MRARVLLIPIVLLLAFGGSALSADRNGLGGWVEDRTTLSPVGGEQLLDLHGAIEKSRAAVSAAPVDVRLPAQVVDFTPHGIDVRTFPSTDHTGEEGPRPAATDWRVVRGTGNAAELWFDITSDGRLLDLGGRYVNYTEDQGETWESVRPTEPLVNAEGSIVQAPNGDVVAITWDAYSGDRVLTYKYEAEEKAWYYMYNVIHTPFWDRPSIEVVPGEFTDPFGDEVPYITFTNGFPHDPWQYSYDGLNYPHLSFRAQDAGETEPIESWLDVEPDPMLDYIQPTISLDQGLIPVFAPLGDGKALSGNLMFTSEDMQWHRWSFPGGETLSGGLQVDSRGWLHNVVRTGPGFDYRLSTDGGRSWTTLEIADGARPGDFRANAEAGVAAVWAIRGTQDLVYKFDITGDEPKLIRDYAVGLGDDSRSGGVGFYGLSGGHRFDFSNIGVFPDGRVAVVFMDSETTMPFPTLGTSVVAPALAIEQDTTVEPSG